MIDIHTCSPLKGITGILSPVHLTYKFESLLTDGPLDSKVSSNSIILLTDTFPRVPVLLNKSSGKETVGWLREMDQLKCLNEIVAEPYFSC